MKKEEIKLELEKMLKNLGVSFTEILLEEDKDRILLSVQSGDSAILIGNSGETLSALNYILRKMVERKIEPEIAIVVDVNGYRKKSEEKVRGIASMLGNRVLTFKSSVEMDPMSSYERRIVHSVFQDHPNISTHSDGFGKFRRVVLKYVEEKTPVKVGAEIEE